MKLSTHSTTSSGKIKLLAIIDDEESGSFYAEVGFTNVDDAQKSTIVPLSALEDSDRLGEILKNRGADIDLESDEDVALLNSLKGQEKLVTRACFASMVGWHSNRRLFVMPKSVISVHKTGKTILPPRAAVATHNRVGTVRGSRESWCNTVGKASSFSSRAVTAVCAALSGPTLTHAGLQSFAIHLYGKSRAGKTTALLAGASVIGFGKESDLPNFRGTEVALEELPASFNDMFLPLNELRLLRGSPKQRAEALNALIFGIAENRGKARSLTTRSESERAKDVWSCVVMANGEESADEIARDAGVARLEGEMFRWIDLPATRGTTPDIFDRAPRALSENERSNWVETQCRRIRYGARKNAGIVGKFYIRKLIKRRKRVRKDIRQLMTSFELRHPTKNNVARQVVKHFALLFASGTYAIRMKALDWDQKIVRESIDLCLKDALRKLPTEDRLLKLGIVDLRKKIGSPEILDLRTKKWQPATPFRRCDGFLRRKSGVTTLTITGSAFKEIFRDPRSRPILLAWLAQKKTGIKIQSKTGRGITWAESQPLWPNGKRIRSIVFRCPKKLLRK